MKKIFVFLFIVSVTCSTWAQNIQWRGDRTGVYNEKGLLKNWGDKGPELLWAFDGLGEGHSSVAIAGDKIYVTGLSGETGFLYVFDKSGKNLKKKEYGKEWNSNYNGSRGTVTVDNGKIYLVSGMGDVVCMDEKSLDVVWKKNMFEDFDGSNITWGVNESPLIAGDKLIVTPGGKKNNVVALNKNTGNLIWNCEGEGELSAYCSPLYIADQKVPQIVTMTAKHIIGIDVATGKKLWSYEQTNKWSVHANTPVYGDNMLLCTSGYGKGSVMLKFTDGGRSVEKAWELPELDSRIGGIVKLGNYAYGSGDANKYWFCIDWKTGEKKYKEKGLNSVGVTIAADGMLYCYSDKGEMAMVRAVPDKFEVLGSFPVTLGTETHWAHPVIHQGILYIRHGDALMAYKI
ncbi:MAG: PQQ-binding-like beta-propeller repeat protein [Prevotellaceae bacterium]|jgi:outer membrane protein assembly factor BamB|nr:PQQ-binding-like beta-propeller repeat protein [Prevotellaceae bacterium]